MENFLIDVTLEHAMFPQTLRMTSMKRSSKRIEFDDFEDMDLGTVTPFTWVSRPGYKAYVTVQGADASVAATIVEQSGSDVSIGAGKLLMLTLKTDGSEATPANITCRFTFDDTGVGRISFAYQTVAAQGSHVSVTAHPVTHGDNIEIDLASDKPEALDISPGVTSSLIFKLEQRIVGAVECKLAIDNVGYM